MKHNYVLDGTKLPYHLEPRMANNIIGKKAIIEIKKGQTIRLGDVK